MIGIYIQWKKEFIFDVSFSFLNEQKCEIEINSEVVLMLWFWGMEIKVNLFKCNFGCFC